MNIYKINAWLLIKRENEKSETNLRNSYAQTVIIYDFTFFIIFLPKCNKQIYEILTFRLG